MSLFSFKKNKETFFSDKEMYSLVISIGSGNINAAIVKFTEKVGVDIVYYTNEVIPFQQNLSISRHLDLMTKAITVLIQKVQKEGIGKLKNKNNKSISISKIFYILSSPWCISQTKTIHIKESNYFKVTTDYINKIINKTESEYHSSFPKKSKIIEKKIIQIKNNGYLVDNINNQSVKDMELSVYFSFADELVLNNVEKAVQKVFDLPEIWCHSSSLAIFSNIRNLFPQKDDFLEINISEEMTDISIINNNILTDLISIPIGRNYFIRRLAEELRISEAVADSMIRMRASKNKDELGHINTAVCLNKTSDDWLLEINKNLDKLKEHSYISKDIFLIANSDLSFFLKEKLEKIDYNVLFVDNKKVKSNLKIEDVIFRLELMFLDNTYKL